MGWKALAALGLAACSFHGESESLVDAVGDGAAVTHDAAQGAWLTGFAHRKHIVIDAGAASLADFPVSIVEDSDPDLAASARTDGGDLVFTSADAVTPIGWELVAFDKPSGAIEAWVNVSLAGEPADVYLYYGGPAMPSTLPAWPASTMAVWHMATPGETVADSSTHDNTASIETSPTAPGPGDGIIGACRSYNGIGDTLQVATSSSLEFTTNSFSYGLWVYVMASAGDDDTPFNKGGNSDSEAPGYDIELGTGSWFAFISDGEQNMGAMFSPETLNHWSYLVAVVDRGAHQFIPYFNGVAATPTDISGVGSVHSTRTLQLGVDTANFFSGLLDEVAIYNTALSPEWIAASYANVSDRASFVAIGPAMSP